MTITMTNEDFTKETQALFKSNLKILLEKGREYQSAKIGEDNVFSNFIRSAEDIGISPVATLKLFMNKHLDSISTFTREIIAGKPIAQIEEDLTEPIEGRISDLINYAVLLNSMINKIRIDEASNQGGE